MRYLGFDNREHSISISDYRVYDDDATVKSSLHLEARKLLKSLFPCDLIMEEVTLPGSKKNGSILYADFFLPLKSLIVEVHGEQHYTYNKFFHGSKLGFIKSKLRDDDKREWCQINNISYVELPFDKIDDWRNLIVSR